MRFFMCFFNTVLLFKGTYPQRRHWKCQWSISKVKRAQPSIGERNQWSFWFSGQYDQRSPKWTAKSTAKRGKLQASNFGQAKRRVGKFFSWSLHELWICGKSLDSWKRNRNTFSQETSGRKAVGVRTNASCHYSRWKFISSLWKR